MTKQEFLQGLRSELDGRVPYSVIQENINYYDSYISGEMAKGEREEQVTESLGSPRLIARTIVDAALDTEDRPDGYQTCGTDDSYRGQSGGAYEEQPFGGGRQSVHYVDFSKWYVKLAAGLIVCAVIFLLIALFFGFLSIFWPVLLVLLIVGIMKGSRR